MPPMSESKGADRIKIEPSSEAPSAFSTADGSPTVDGSPTGDRSPTADCSHNHMDAGTSMKNESGQCAHDEQMPPHVDDEAEHAAVSEHAKAEHVAVSEHAKALVSLQALDDSAQAIDALPTRRSRSEPDLEHLETVRRVSVFMYAHVKCFFFFSGQNSVWCALQLHRRCSQSSE